MRSPNPIIYLVGTKSARFKPRQTRTKRLSPKLGPVPQEPRAPIKTALTRFIILEKGFEGPVCPCLGPKMEVENLYSALYGHCEALINQILVWDLEWNDKADKA